MGTSSSFRSPQTPRWRALNRAFELGLPLERISVQLFLAGEPEWRSAFDNPALASFAETLLEAHARLSERLEKAERPAPVIAAVVSEARSAMFDEDFTVALPVAERALKRVLISTLQSDVSVADADGATASAAWAANRGAPEDLVVRFVGEMFGQWAAQVAARDGARLVDFDGESPTAAVREWTHQVASYVGDVAASSVAAAGIDTADVGSQWQRLIETVFSDGRKMRPTDAA